MIAQVLLAAALACPVNGQVTDVESAELLREVDVEVLGEKTRTDDDGRFALEAPCGAKMHFSRADYWPSEAPAAENMQIALRARRLTRLSDVVVLAPLRLSQSEDFQSIDAEALARVRGRTLSEALDELPEVTLLSSGPRANKPVVRGLFGRRLLMLVDGVRHEGQDWAVDHAPEIDPMSAGKLAVVDGPAAMRYGADAVGGAILVSPRELRLTEGVDGELSLAGVSNGLRGVAGVRVDAAVQTPVGLLSGRALANLTRGAAMSAPTYVLGNTANSEVNASLMAGLSTTVMGRALDAKLSLLHHQSTLGICYCLSNANEEALLSSIEQDTPRGSDAWLTTYEIDRPRQQVIHDTALARARLSLSDDVEGELSYSFQLDLRDEFDTVRNADTRGSQLGFDLQTHQLDLVLRRLSTTLGSIEWTAEAGVSTSLQTHRRRGLRLIPAFSRLTGGAFALAKLRAPAPLGSVELEAAARVDGVTQLGSLTDDTFFALKRRERIDESDCRVEDDAAFCPFNALLPSGALALKWRADLGFDLKFDTSVNVSLSTRAPDVDEQYLIGNTPSFPVLAVGLPRASPETARALRLDTSLRHPSAELRASAFSTDFDNYIMFGPVFLDDGRIDTDRLPSGAVPVYAMRATDARIFGASGELLIGPNAPVSALLQAALVRGVDLSSAKYLPLIPPATARASLRWRQEQIWFFDRAYIEATADARLVQRRVDQQTDLAPPPDGVLLMGARAGVTFDAQHRPLNVEVEVRNALDTRYRDYLNLLRYYADAPGREVWLRLSWAFGEKA